MEDTLALQVNPLSSVLTVTLLELVRPGRLSSSVAMVTLSDSLTLSQVRETVKSVVTAGSTVTLQVSCMDVPAVRGEGGVARRTVGGDTVGTCMNCHYNNIVVLDHEKRSNFAPDIVKSITEYRAVSEL